MNLADIAVVIPALDEAENVGGVIDAVPAGVRILVVDNGSTDATRDVARRHGALVIDESRRGYGSAIQAGMRALSADPPQVMVVLDADHADDPTRIPELAAPILDGTADFVLSDRTQLAEPHALTTVQRLGNRFAVGGMRLTTGHAYADMGPFRAIRWTSLQALQLEDPTWGWNIEMQMKAVRHGLRIVEIPMPYRCRRAGRSKISGTVIGTVRAGYRILQTLARHAAP